MTREKLANPPIVEVVCGLRFASLPLDPLLVGTYWNERKDEYPKRAIQPPISEMPALFEGVGPLRSWLVSADETFLIQVQHDRFYINWRKRSGEYPRFSDHLGKPAGILSKTKEEFARFQEFCERALGRRPTPQRVDLAKIDHIIEGLHWNGLSDLAELVPWLKPFAGFSNTLEPNVALRFSEQRKRGALAIMLDTAIQVGEEQVRLVKLETRLSDIGVTEFADDLKWANDQLNRVFESLTSDAERTRRFN